MAVQNGAWSVHAGNIRLQKHSYYVIFTAFVRQILLQNAPNRYSIFTLNKLLLVRVQEGGGTKYLELNSIMNSQH